GRDDGNAEAIADRRQLAAAGVHAPARLRNTGDVLDRGLALEILQFDPQRLVLAGRVFAVATDVAFALEHFEHVRTQLRGRGQDAVLLGLLPVADAGEHITQGIGQCHFVRSSPARLGQTGNQALVAQIPNLDPVEAELAVNAAGAAGGGAAVAHAGGVRVARDFRELQTRDQAFALVERLVVGNRLEPRVLAGKLLHELLATLVLVDGTQFRHGLKLSYGRSRGLLFFGLSIGLRGRERETEQLQQLARFVVGLGSGGDDDVEPTHLLDLVGADLGEHDLFLETHRIVAVTVERARVEPTEVADTRHGDGHQTVEELVHALPAQGHLATDRHAFTQLELRDRLLGLGDDRLLTGDQGHFLGRSLDLLLVLAGFAHAHVERDLIQAGDLEPVLVAELLGHRLNDAVLIVRLQARSVIFSHRSFPRT